MTKEVLKLALEALEDLGMKHFENTGEVLYKETFTAIKEALAQPEQEPDGVALTNITHPKGAPAPDDLNADALEVVELELPDEDEAVGWADGGVINWIAGKQFKHASYLYTTPPQRKPLTDEEILSISADCASSHQHTDIHFARAIEAKLRSKNNG